MKLIPNLPDTVFKPPRGYGLDALPNTGRQALQGATFHTLDELKQASDLVYRPGDIFLGRIDDRMIGVRDNRHIMTIAGSRSGKSACLLIPNLRLYPGSALVIDPKGELAETTASHRAEKLGHRVVVLDPFEVANVDPKYRGHHDPLSELDELSGDFIDDAAVLAEALVVDSGGDEHWTIAARNLLVGLILFARIGERSLADVRQLLTGDPAALWESMANFYDPEYAEEVQEAFELVRATGASMRFKSDREGPAIVSSALEQLGFLRSPAMRRLMSRQDVSLTSLKRSDDGRPVTIYLVLPSGRMGTHSRWLRALVTQALMHFERLPGTPEHPIVMVLEEFAALGHLGPVERAAGFIAGAGVRLWCVLQDLAQLQTHYDKGWETFLGNAGVLQAFSVSDLTTTEYLSKRMGETTIETTRREQVGTEQFREGDAGERREFRTLPLLTPSEIAIEFARISENGEARGGLSLVLMPEYRPFVVDRVFWGELS